MTSAATNENYPFEDTSTPCGHGRIISKFQHGRGCESKHITAVLLLLVTLARAEPPATQPADLSLDDIVKGLAEAETKIKTICVRNFVTTVSTQQKGAAAWTDTPMKYAGTAWYESPESPKARIHFTDIVMKWENGAAAWARSSQDLSFDGTIGRTLLLTGGAWNRKPHRDRSAQVGNEPPFLLKGVHTHFASGVGFSVQYVTLPYYFSQPPRPRKPMSKILAPRPGAKIQPQLSREKVNDFDCVRIHYAFNGGSHTYWFSPDRGYALIKWEMLIDLPQEKEREGLEVSKLKEVAPGLWFPSAASIDLRGGPEMYRLTYQADEITVNSRDRDPKLFDVSIPAGFIVQDLRDKEPTTHIMQPDGKPQPVGVGQPLPNTKVREFEIPTGP